MYKLGRRPAMDKPCIKFKQIRKRFAGVPVHPEAIDYLSNLQDWQMLGNDEYGDCNAVCVANDYRKVTATLTKEYYWSKNEVLQFYKTQNPDFPNEDNGMYMQVGLEYLNKYGSPNGVKVVAFAQVDFNNVEEVKAAIAIFGGIHVGVAVQSANQNDFINNDPWEYRSDDYTIGGHAVEVGGYLGKPKNDIRFITWAKETGFTDNFWNNLVEEAWVVIWPEHLGTKQFQEGIDLAALATIYRELTGRDLPIDVKVTGVSVSPTSTSLNVGQTRTISATVFPTGATNKKVNWTSSNTSIADVDFAGMVTANSEGNAQISVVTDDGMFSDSCSVTVKNTGCLPNAVAKALYGR
jgi:uncharacterized protein YjdB